MDGWWMNRWTDVVFEGCMEEVWLSGGEEGWDGWTHGWMDGWLAGFISEGISGRIE